MKKMLFAFLFVLVGGILSMSAQVTVSGTVTEKGGEPLVGVSVLLNGTSRGTTTDIDGNYTIADVPNNGVLTFRYFGMATQEVKVNGRSNISLEMHDDALKLDEVVVIGYGSAKAKDLTAPIAVVKGEDILNVPSTSPMGALTGKVPGVNIVNAGAPGEGPTVRIRGIGSFSASTPLYVVDGMFYDNINFLNNDDIAEMSILKDASAAAIYGVKAANGVVIITTKKGVRNQKAKITYNGYVGIQKAQHLLKMCNSNEYAQMLMEANPTAYSNYLQASIDRFGGKMDAANGIYDFAANTDWYDELLRTAVMTNHSLNISGGSEKATYSVGLSYLYQNGIMKAESDYNRLNFRAQLDYQATNWMKVGFNGVFSKSTQQVASRSAWQQAFNMPGIMPVYDESNELTFPEKFASPAVLGFDSNFYNPIARAKYNNEKNENYQALTNFFADFTILPSKLTFRTSYGYDFSSVRYRNMQIPYYVSEYQQVKQSKLTKSTSDYNKWVWDNVLTYKDSWGKHSFGAMVGYSMRQDTYNWLQGDANDVPIDNESYWYLHQGDRATATSDDDATRYRSQSVFTRLNYEFDNRYLLMFTFRADGTSKYQEKWGYFPSVGAAWNISNENFMKNQSWADFLKLRASWGMLGNDNVPASDGFASIKVGNGASGVFGSYGYGVGLPYSGYQNTTYFSWLKWEKVAETNVGLTYSTFNSRLTADIDWFYRITSNAVISPLIPFTTTSLAGNYGKILNTGFDVSIDWNDKVGDFAYYAGFNFSTLRNRVQSLDGRDYILGGKTINMVGERINSYYGYKVAGIYQTQAEIDADVKSGFITQAQADGIKPGFFRYEDVNGDGVYDSTDRTTLGSYLPSFTYGVNFGFTYKNFDFALSTYGQHGAKLYNRKRQLRYAQTNYNFDYDQYKNRWTGPGSTNKYPSALALTQGWNVASSTTASNDYFVESADFFRIQNITLGYTFKNIRMGSYTMPGIRVSLTADRPLTVFSANSFTPEITDPEGWDTEVYPLQSTYTLGVQIDF
ncbi:MAG: SusC/RagA family TonB-linked outer membrane protein [Muribaculaceae bacterium]|nr:TonB-dependent receptor [Muribaculaceae bacterium]